MRSICRSALLLGAVVVAVVVAAAAPAQAQTGVADDCVADLIEARADAGAWRGIRPSDVRRRLAGVRTQGRWSAMVDSIRAIYLGRQLTGLTTADSATLLAHLDSLQTELRAGENDPAEQARGRLNAMRFRLFHDDADDSYVLFRGMRSAAQIRLGDATPEATRIAVCGTALAASDVSAQFTNPAFRRLAASLNRRVERWDRFMDDGYSMLPHELLLNGLIIPRAELEPPKSQLVVAHPSVGTVVASRSFETLRDARREDVLALEVIGLLGYGPEHRWFGGATWVITFPTTGGIGSGVMVHVPKLGRVAAIVRPTDADGIRRNGLLLSVDVYDALTGAPEKWRRLKERAAACVEDPARCAADR